MSELISLGEPLLEFNAAESAPLHAVRTFTVGYGGDTSNTAIAARRSGASVGYATRVGDDEFGTALVGLWESEGVDTSAVTREEGGRTGIYFISRDPEHSAFTYYRADSPASRLSPDNVPLGTIEAARILYLSGITQAISTSACAAGFRAIQAAHAAGTLVAYDPNHRPALWGTDRAREVLTRIAAVADIVLPNLEEGRLFSGADEPEDVLAWFVALGAGTVVLKMGADGALLAHDGDVVPIPPRRVDPVDSTGAGDTFNGAFLARLLADDSAASAAHYAAAAAALATQGHGAVDPIPTRAAVLAALDPISSPGSPGAQQVRP